MSKRKYITVSIALLLVLLITLVGSVFYYQKHINKESKRIITTDKDVSFESISEWTDTYRIYVMYPVTTNAKIGDSIKAELDPVVDNFRTQATKSSTDPNMPYDLNFTAEINYSNPSVINIVYHGKQYTGGQDVSTEQNRLFERKSGDRITTDKLFKDQSYLGTLSTLTRQQLPNILSTNFSQQIVNKGTEPIATNFDQFEINKDGEFVVMFKPGQVANEAIGTVKVAIPSQKISSILTSDSLNSLFPEAAKSLALAQKKAAEAADKAAKAAEKAKPQQNTGKTDCSVKKCIALTFDDGPGVYTTQFLDLFKQYNAKVTYFVIGRQVAARSDIVARADKEGHDIGIHTWDHLDMKKLTDAQLQDQINRTNQAIVNATGRKSYLIRPPYGSYNQSSVAVANMPFIMWNVDPLDWKNKDANTVYNSVMSNAKPGSIVLSHSIYSSTLEAYKRIIPDLIKQGYTLVTISDMYNIDPNNPPAKVYR